MVSVAGRQAQLAVARFLRLRKVYQLGLVLVLAVLSLFTGRFIYFNLLTNSQVTYLSPHCPGLTKSTFPYIYMPVPKTDSRLVYYGNKDLAHLLKITNFILEERPSWSHKRTYIIKSIMLLGGVLIPSELTNKTHELYGYLSYSEVPWKMAEIQYGLKYLNQRIYPTELRPTQCGNCFPYDFKRIMGPKDLCAKGTKVEMVFLVTTIPQNVEERTMVRRTWGANDLQMKYNFRVVFLFGSGWPEDMVEMLTKENNQYNDILMDDFHDNYYNLTQKVLMGYRWVLSECASVKFVIRSADDTWIDIIALFNLIHTNAEDEAFQKHQIGHCFPGYIPYRAPDYKGYLSTYEYDKDVFPPYALGTVFITSIGLTKELVDISPNVPYIAIEDAYFGLALAQLGRGCHHVRGMLGHYTTHTEKENMAKDS